MIIVKEVTIGVDEDAEWEACFRIERPRVKIVCARATQEVIIPAACKECVMITGRSGRAVVAEKPVVAAEAEQRVAAGTAVEPIAPAAA